MNYFHQCTGDVAAPNSAGAQIIAHVCNDVGVWTGNAARSISKRWPQAKQEFLKWYKLRKRNEFGLGAVQFVNSTRAHVNRQVRVANMVAATGCGIQRGVPPVIKRHSLSICLAAIAKKAQRLGATVHMPRLGSRNSSPSHQELENVIRFALCDLGISVYVYTPPIDLEGEMFGRVVWQNEKQKRSDN